MDSFTARLMLILALLAGIPASLCADIRDTHPRIFVNDDPVYFNCLDSLRARVTQDPWRAEYEKLRLWNNSFDDVPPGRKNANVLPGYALRWLIDSTDTAAADTALAMLLALEDDDGQSWNLTVAAIAYDWLYHYKGFSRDDRRYIRERIAAWTRDVIQQIETDDDVFNNHTWYHLRAVYLAGLALYHEDDEAPEWIQFADRYWKDNLVGAIRLFEGGWHEGLSYSCRASLNNLGMWLAAWESAVTPRRCARTDRSAIRLSVRGSTPEKRGDDSMAALTDSSLVKGERTLVNHSCFETRTLGSFNALFTIARQVITSLDVFMGGPSLSDYQPFVPI